MDEAWHALPLGVSRCQAGTHCHCMVFDCVAWCNVLCRQALPLRWRETVLHCSCCVGTHCHCTVWHTVPRCTLAHTATVLCGTRCHSVLWHALCLAHIANESCDSCRVGATTCPLIIILCLQHTTFLLFTPFLLVRNVIVRGPVIAAV